MTAWTHHLIIAPILIPLVTAAALVFLDERQRTLADATAALTKANTVKASPLDQVSGLEIFMSDRSKASEQTPDSPGNAAVVQNGQEFAMRMQAMIEAWEGTSGTARNAALDRKL